MKFLNVDPSRSESFATEMNTGSGASMSATGNGQKHQREHTLCNLVVPKLGDP